MSDHCLIHPPHPPHPPRKPAATHPTLLAPPATAARGVIAALLSAGVDTFFVVPGGPIWPLLQAVIDTPGARLVESRHESHAAFAAMGYHRASGRAAAVLVTAGPGATNAVTGVTAAFLERVPLLLVSGDVAWASTGGRVLQDSGPEGVAVEAMFAPVVRAAIRASRADSAATQALAALRAATDPLRPGPALFVLPMDLASTPARAALPEPSRVRAEARPPAESVRTAARWMAEAERPLLVVGAGARGHEASVERLVDALGVPFFTTPQAKGLVSEEHPLSLRHGGLAASFWARRYTAGGVDAALVLGTDLDDISIGPTRPVAADRPDARLVHVDLDARVFHRNFPAALPVLADLGAFADDLAALVLRERLQSRRGPALAREIHRASPFDVPDFADDDAPHLAPHRAVADLEAAAGPRARFVTDIGEHMLFALHYLTARGPGAFTIHLGLGSMASGIAGSVGQALADRERPVICICGDGGMQMAGMEILVAARERLRVVYAVFNDARWNMVYHGYQQLTGRAAPWDTRWIDFVAWAGALGIPAARIDRPGQLTAEMLERLTADGPAVLDVRIDRDTRIRGAGRNEALHHMSLGPAAGARSTAD